MLSPGKVDRFLILWGRFSSRSVIRQNARRAMIDGGPCVFYHAQTRDGMTLKDTENSGRRAFFRNALAQAVSPISDYLERRLEVDSDRHLLRPPGAIEEDRFLDTCRRCGACVEVCPVAAIFPLLRSYGEAAGTPAIDPDQAACVVCTGLRCTHACPSGALQPVFDASDMRMGLAEVYDPLCERAQGRECTLCVDRCPIGDTAIRLKGAGPPAVLASGCVGCGVCQLYCPTQPTAIVVKPLHVRENGPGRDSTDADRTEPS